MFLFHGVLWLSGCCTAELCAGLDVSTALPGFVFGEDSNKKALWKEFQRWIWALRFLFEALFNPLSGPNLSICWSQLPVSAQPMGVLHTCHLLHHQKHLSSISDSHTVTTPRQTPFPGCEERTTSLGSWIWRMVWLMYRFSHAVSCG